MLKSKKVEVVSDLKKVFEDGNAVFIFHYKGMNVESLNDLRNKINNEQGNLKIVKNKLAAIAVSDSDSEEIKEYLKGPTAMAWSLDGISIAKILFNFAKQNQNLKIIAGSLNSKLLKVKDVEMLATLPSLDELRAKILGLINTPARNIASILQKPASSVATVIAGYSKK